MLFNEKIVTCTKAPKLTHYRYSYAVVPENARGVNLICIASTSYFLLCLLTRITRSRWVLRIHNIIIAHLAYLGTEPACEKLIKNRDVTKSKQQLCDFMSICKLIFALLQISITKKQSDVKVNSALLQKNNIVIICCMLHFQNLGSTSFTSSITSIPNLSARRSPLIISP